MICKTKLNSTVVKPTATIPHSILRKQEFIQNTENQNVAKHL